MNFLQKQLKPYVGSLIVLVLLKVFCPQLVVAQETKSGPYDSLELETFMDGLMKAHLGVYQIAGSTVSVVKDGKVIFAKGYGLADISQKNPVLAEKTLFRIGSISKLFVWTAIMQLVEQGQLDLQTDINHYLNGLIIPATYKQPVTLGHLMAHTAGFEECNIGLFSKTKESLRPLQQILQDELPSRVRPPGELASYSNHGAAIAAYIVEQVSGKSWDEYVEEYILKPLEMHHTTFRQPVPESLTADLSQGYSYSRSGPRRRYFEYIPMAPIGSASSTAADIAKFMIAHLQLGKFGDNRILQASTAQKMQTTLFRNAPEINPMLHGFIDMSRKGQRIIGHDGSTFWFHSLMALLPEQNIGLFVSFNTQRGKFATSKILNGFLEHYFPEGDTENLAPTIAAMKPQEKNLQRFIGHYNTSRFSHTKISKLGATFNKVEIILLDNNMLSTISHGTLVRWIQIAPLVFRAANNSKRLAFREDRKGHITHLFFQDSPAIAFEKTQLIDLPSLHIGLAAISFTTFIAVVLFWPSSVLVRRRYRIKKDPGTLISPWVRFVTWITCICLIAFVYMFSEILKYPDEMIAFGLLGKIKSLLVFPVVMIFIAGGAAIYTVKIWIVRQVSLWDRVHYTFVTLMFILFLWQLNHWNLLGFNF